MRFDLETWGDGTTRLAHWDHLHGNDVIFVLCEDGSAFKSADNAEESLKPIDLVPELYALVREWEKKAYA